MPWFSWRRESGFMLPLMCDGEFQTRRRERAQSMHVLSRAWGFPWYRRRLVRVSKVWHEQVIIALLVPLVPESQLHS